MASYSYETFAQNLYDNFSDNSLEKNWEHFENKWEDEKGEGVIKDHSYIHEMNIADTSDIIKKKCLVIKATGDNYPLDEPKGFKKGKSKRLGGGVKSKDLMGPGEYNIRVKFSSFNSVCNALWLFNYMENEVDEPRHIKKRKFCVDNDVDNTCIRNPEIDFELLDMNKCRCNTYRSTEGQYEEKHIDLNDYNLELNDSKWHNMKIIWETDLVKVSNLIGRELKQEEVIITKENQFINDIQLKKFNELNGQTVIKSVQNHNEYCLIYGKKLQISIDNKILLNNEIEEINYKIFNNNTIPITLCHFYIALWFPKFIKTDPDFYHTLLQVDTFQYLYNGNPYLRLVT